MRMYVYKATSWISLSIWIEIVVGAGLVDHSDCFPLCVLRSTHGHSLQFASECLRSLCFSAILSALLVRPLLLNYPTLDTRMPFSTIHLLFTRPRFFPLWKIFNTRTSRAKWQPLTASLPSHVYQPTKQLLRRRFYEFLGNWPIADHSGYFNWPLYRVVYKLGTETAYQTFQMENLSESGRLIKFLTYVCYAFG